MWWCLQWFHGNYICECQNAGTRVSGGSLKAGFIKNTKTFNTWIRTKHIAADMQHVLNLVLKIQIMSTHIDTTPSGIRKHFTNVNKLKEIRHAYCGYDFFAYGPVKMISIAKSKYSSRRCCK